MRTAVLLSLALWGVLLFGLRLSLVWWGLMLVATTIPLVLLSGCASPSIESGFSAYCAAHPGHATCP